jgi:hypothetical protein
MVSDEILKTKLNYKLDKLKLSNEAKNKLVSELNLLSNNLIDIFLYQKGYDRVDN